MVKVTVKFNNAGIQELLKSEEMQAIINEKANEVQARAGDGYETVERVGKKRAFARVRVASAKAYYDNLKNNTLLKALGEK